MSNVTRIITVPITINKTHLSYTIYVNPSVEAVKNYAENNPNVYVFIFYMHCSVEQIPDWNVQGDWTARVLKPWCVSGTAEAEQILEMTLKEWAGEWRMV